MKKGIIFLTNVIALGAGCLGASVVSAQNSMDFRAAREEQRAQMQQRREEMRGTMMDRREELNTSMEDRREQFNMRMEERREEFRSRADEMKQRIKDRRETLRAQWEEKKAALSKRRKQNIKQHMERVTQRMQAALDRLELLAEKIAIRITLLKERGADAGDLETSLADAKNLITQGQSALDAASAALRTSPDAENPADAIGSARVQFEDVKTKIREAHAALVDVVTSLKGRSPISESRDTGSTSEEVTE